MSLQEAIIRAKETGCYFYNNFFAYRFEDDSLVCYVHYSKPSGIERNCWFGEEQNIFTVSEILSDWTCVMNIKVLRRDERPKKNTLANKIRTAILSKKES